MADWEPIHNPYIVGNPIKGAKLFFGRKEDFAYINSKFVGGKEGGLIVLCGARRSGKTSILFQILDGRLGSDFLPVLVDMQSMAIVNDRQLIRRLLELIENAATDAGLAPGSAEITDNPFADVEAYVARLSRVLAGKKLVLAFDEYELIETGIDSGAISTQVLHTLANLVEHRQVFVVFTGSEKLEERAKKYWDVFLSKALHRRISFLSRDDTMRLIREPVEGALEYSAGVPERVYDLTAGQPFYTQVICQSLVDHLNDERKRLVDLEDVERAVEEVVQNPLPQMIFHWNALSDLQKLALAIIAEQTRKERKPVTAADILAFVEAEKLGYKVDPNTLNKELDRLFHGDLAQKDEKRGTYEFKMDLWRLWAMRMHSVWQVIGEIDQAGGPAADSGITRARTAAPAWRKYAWIAAVIVIAAGGYMGLKAMNSKETLVATPGGAVSSQHAGVFAVKTTPAGAEIFIDGVSYGRSPVFAAVRDGAHALRAEMPGFATLTHEGSVSEGDTAAIDLALVELTGDVVVETEPTNARVTLEDGTVMQSPARLRGLSVSQPHRVVVALEGYEAGSLDVRAFPDSTIRVRHVFSHRTAPLVISSTPNGATVIVDGKDVGTTPLPITKVSYGAHEIRMSLAGYEEWSGTVVVPVANDRLDISLNRQQGGTIEVRVKPWANLYVDGKLIAEIVTNRKVSVEVGTHVVELRNPTFTTFTQQVTVDSGDNQIVDHRFTE